MGMRLSYLTVAVAALLTAACPYDHLLTSNRGIAIGGGGGRYRSRRARLHGSAQ